MLLLSCVWAAAQSYSVDWHRISGGGGTSAGGVYSLTGTIGQPEAGPWLSGGDFTVWGGFWPGILEVPSSGLVPTLYIRAAGGSITIWWSPTTPGFFLEQRGAFEGAPWEPVAAGNPVVIAPDGAARFFRLRKPGATTGRP